MGLLDWTQPWWWHEQKRRLAKVGRGIKSQLIPLSFDETPTPSHPFLDDFLSACRSGDLEFVRGLVTKKSMGRVRGKKVPPLRDLDALWRGLDAALRLDHLSVAKHILGHIELSNPLEIFAHTNYRQTMRDRVAVKDQMNVRDLACLCGAYGQWDFFHQHVSDKEKARHQCSAKRWFYHFAVKNNQWKAIYQSLSLPINHLSSIDQQRKIIPRISVSEDGPDLFQHFDLEKHASILNSWLHQDMMTVPDAQSFLKRLALFPDLNLKNDTIAKMTAWSVRTILSHPDDRNLNRWAQTLVEALAVINDHTIGQAHQEWIGRIIELSRDFLPKEKEKFLIEILENNNTHLEIHIGSGENEPPKRCSFFWPSQSFFSLQHAMILLDLCQALGGDPKSIVVRHFWIDQNKKPPLDIGDGKQSSLKQTFDAILSNQEMLDEIKDVQEKPQSKPARKI